ncbi:MAG: hypothetical protein E7411_03445 [Ruminococcaceae bacterium]|nr:hypothetical protein [Oscillospiraceae bacterium]
MNIDAVSLYNLTDTPVEFENGEDIIKIKTPDHEEGFGLIVKNENASTDADIVIKGGNSVMAMGDIVVSVPKGCEVLINLKDTGRFKNVYGEDAGYIVINVEKVSGTDVSVFAFGL